MHIRVNDESYSTDATTVGQLVGEFTGHDISGECAGIAVAVDGNVVPRSQWSRELSEGLVVDILTAVQGG